MSQIVRIGRVVSIDDSNDCGRILVHLKPEDDAVYTQCGGYNKEYYEKMKDNWAFPLLPKYLFVMPQRDEYVLVFNAVSEDGYSQRYYIGPIFPQLINANGCTSLNALSATESSAMPIPPALGIETYGAMPSKNDISIIGKKNCDIQITENDVRLRAGVKVFNGKNSVKLNTKNNCAVFKLKYDDNGFTDSNGNTINSTATILADRINLIGNSTRICNLFGDEASTQNDIMKSDLIPDEQMKEILDKAHQLPYGDILLDYLRLFNEAFNKHTHKWVGAGQTPVANKSYVALNEFPVDTILSDSVRIS